MFHAESVRSPEISPLVWRPIYETGIADLDAQHRRLFELVAEVGERARLPGGDRAATFEEIFDRLADYAQFHFDYEEDLLAAADLPQAKRQAHQATHQAFIRQLQDLWRERNGFEHAGETLHRFLAAWLTDHVLEEDLVTGLGRRSGPAAG